MASAIHTKHIAMNDKHCSPFSLDHSILPLMIKELVIQVMEHVFEQRHAAWQKAKCVFGIFLFSTLSRTAASIADDINCALPDL
jgi:hypothetical protein